MLSVSDIFKIGIGPSSSHTLGPMKIARRFLTEASGALEGLDACDRIVVGLYGSLALTGVGHGTDRAVALGLAGLEAESIDPDKVRNLIAEVQESHQLQLLGRWQIRFNPETDIQFAPPGPVPDAHPNGMRLTLYKQGEVAATADYYSIGGGFVRRSDEMGVPEQDGSPPPFPFEMGQQLLAQCEANDLSVAQLVMANEGARRPAAETEQLLDGIWQAMARCINRGLSTRGTLPGGLSVSRRAPALYDKLLSTIANEREVLFDWLNAFAMAVNEENAAGGQVVTSPTNGAAGIIPAVIKFYCAMDGVTETGKVRTFLLTAGGIAMLYKARASISGAEMGCQGEVGVACSMAAAGLAAVWGGSPAQVARAAEIGMEHNLGLTCDPVGGLVQIPCIERNAIGAVKAVNAARLALRSDDPALVSLDQVIETMRQTGEDMNHKYKETSQGGLAVNVVEC